jgi:hypothetical protein
MTRHVFRIAVNCSGGDAACRYHRQLGIVDPYRLWLVCQIDSSDQESTLLHETCRTRHICNPFSPVATRYDKRTKDRGD